MAALPPFPQPDTATQNLLGIQGDITHIQTSGFESAYACTFNDTAAVLYVYNLGQQSPGLALLHRLASQPPHPHVISVLARHDGAQLSYAVAAQGYFLDEVNLVDELAIVHPGGFPHFPEATARAHFAQILSGLRHMHRLGVAHRDIKLENIMITQHSAIRLTDYRLSMAVPTQDPPDPIFGNTQGNGVIGSPKYRAPEVTASNNPAVGGPYDIFAADVWSLGCVLFVMSTGFFLFNVADPDDPRFARALWAQLMGLSTVGAMYHMYGWPHPLNAGLVTLLDGMLRINPAERMTLDDICQSPWLSDVSAAVFAHDNVVPIAPELWRVGALAAGLDFGAELAASTEDLAAAAAAAAAAAPEYQSLAAGPSSLAPSYRGLAAELAASHRGLAAELAASYRGLAAGPSSLGSSYRSLAAEPSSPVRVVTSFEELEAAMARAGVPRVEPLPLTRETERATRAVPYLL